MAARWKFLKRYEGKKKFQKRLLEVIVERGTDDFSDIVFGITHTGNVEEVEEINQEITERFHSKGFIATYMGATMGTYVGKDGMIVSF